VLAMPVSSAKDAEGVFKGLLTTNRDGLMVYGLGPIDMKPDIDLAGRVEVLAGLRKLVGPRGILMGRATREVPSQVEMAFMDTVVVPSEQTGRFPPGPAAVGCAVSPMVKPDSRRIAARVASVPASPHLMLGPGVTNTSLVGLWQLWSRIDKPVLHALSPHLENRPALIVEPNTVPAVAYLTRTHLLLVVASPRRTTGCKITFAPGLGIAADAAGKLLTVADDEVIEAPVRLQGGVIAVPQIKQGTFRGYLFERQQ